MDFDLSAFEYEDDRTDAQRLRDAHEFLWYELLGTFEFSLGRRGVTARTLSARADVLRQIGDIETAADQPARDALAAERAAMAAASAAAAGACSGAATAAPADAQAERLGIAAVTLTPRILSQRPIAARVRAGLLLTI